MLLVHRPRYRDWTFPKGKVKDGEAEEDAAVREVQEETGLLCALGPELAGARYTDLKLRAKTVRYWRMDRCAGTFQPSDEVDEVEWLPLDAAAARLSYDRDRDVLASLGSVT